MRQRELLIVGGGPAGMAAALTAHKLGVRDILLIERDQFLGGILNQCVHAGFGLTYFKEMLTGPEYAQRFIDRITAIPEIEVSLRSFAVALTARRVLTYLKPGSMEQVRCRALIMATGCRERTREMVHVAGTRPAGVFSAGLAQKLINCEGLLPGRRVVVVGSGDIGLIMARRFVLEGAEVSCVIEIEDSSRGLARNVAQCLDDFNIPLYCRHRVVEIIGADRVQGVRVVQIDEKRQDIPGTLREIACDTVLVSVGLIPENELLEMAGARIDATAHTPVADELNMTSLRGVFVCGNACKVYDLADSVTHDSVIAGEQAARYLRGSR
jgi:thioredoxin reductase